MRLYDFKTIQHLADHIKEHGPITIGQLCRWDKDAATAKFPRHAYLNEFAIIPSDEYYHDSATGAGFHPKVFKVQDDDGNIRIRDEERYL